MARTLAAPVDRGARPGIEAIDLARAAAVFFGQPSPLIITSCLVAAGVGRLYVGGYRWWDLLVPGVVLSGTAAVMLLPFPLGLALSGLVGAYAMTLAYEWTHYLIHSPYRPRHALYRYVWRAHRNHHFRNEHYWFGVAMHLADHVLRTFPERSAVELSPTARTLGVDAA